MGRIIGKQHLTDYSVSVGKNETAYSESIFAANNDGFTSVLIGSTAGSITVSVQGSMDGVNFYDVVSKTGTVLGGVASAMTVGTKLVNFDSLYAPYIRFKIVEGNVAASVVSITLSLKRRT